MNKAVIALYNKQNIINRARMENNLSLEHAYGFKQALAVEDAAWK